MDGELAPADVTELNLHLDRCPSCAREHKLLMLPRRIARALPVFQPSEFFYRRLRAQLEPEGQSLTLWQVLLGLSRQMVPALGILTLALLTVFAYVQLRGSAVDVYQAYDGIFMPTDRPNRMVIADYVEFTDESLLLAIAEQETALRPVPALDAPKK